MTNIANLLTEHMAIWTAADTEKKSGRGRASGNAGRVYGVKKLRELILELAVRGKLLPQDPNDEPASELLKRIQAEKAKLIAEGKLKKEKPLAPISDDEKPFNLPKGWDWVRLGQTGRIFNGNSINENEKLDKYTNLKNGYPFIATKDVGYGREEIDYDNGVLIPKEECSLKVAKKSAVLICAEGGSAGKKVGITNQDICFGNKLFANELWIGIEPFYIFHLYQSVTFYSLFQQKMTGIIGGISLNEFLSIPAPIPPLTEQHRIVAKVDELMALCDQLEQQHSNAKELHETLVSQLLATLTQSQNVEEFNANWQRIYTHFDVLFTTEASIDALKQTLLQLAVMGKLVPQDPNDEPASKLLKRIQTEKAKMIAEGKLKKEKLIAPIGEDEKPYETPLGWSWVRLNKLLTKIGAGSTPLGGKQVYVNDGIPFLRSQNVWDEGLRLDDVAYITIDTHNKMLGTHVKSGDLLFNITGASIGRCAIVPEDFSTGNVSQHVTIIRFASTEILRFMHLVMTSKHVQQTVMDVQVGVSREGLSIGKLGQFVIPIPPLAEQHRIVAKVDALMLLCDQLKTRIQQANQQQQTIADALVAQAVA